MRTCGYEFLHMEIISIHKDMHITYAYIPMYAYVQIDTSTYTHIRTPRAAPRVGLASNKHLHEHAKYMYTTHTYAVRSSSDRTQQR
jgi:hypothetical protein